MNTEICQFGNCDFEQPTEHTEATLPQRACPKCGGFPTVIAVDPLAEWLEWTVNAADVITSALGRR